MIDKDKMDDVVKNAREELSYNTGIHFEKYGKIPKKVTGMKEGTIYELEEKDYLCESFSKIEWNDKVVSNIEARGYRKPTPVQQWCVRY